MKISKMKPVLYVAVCSAFLFSCVPARQLEEMKKKKEACEKENTNYKTENEALTTKTTELGAAVEILKKRISGLELDSTVRGTSLKTMTTNYDQLNKTYQELMANLKELNEGKTTETQKILKELQSAKDSLISKEDALKKLAASLEAKEKNLNTLSKELETSKTDLEKSQSELDAKSAKLAELQSILNKKDSTVKALKNKVLDALTGYEGKGLTITQKNGKVYVSLEESLLFASGSFTVDAKGVDAIKKLSKVLETNTDINVLIEGHTDNVPYNGTGALKDNWDLSVMRATAIVKIITANSSVEPKRLTAAGRSQYDPITPNSTKEEKAKNRRIEIILTPKLDELFQIIESN
ncbi:MAG TPA: OmpA family protein [Bacteroidales bacterium]|nr:OmpA family protein [Bacteroidales bacterium]HPS17609.1 OmpA family protein [Bacteroidales bacterium]